MPVIGAAYLRCSDPRQDKSIEQQREEISRRAAADGVTIPDDLWFIDEGISGRTAKKRAAYQALLRRAEAQRDAKQKRAVPFQQIDRLYVWAFSRVARNMFDCLRALATLDEADVDVISLTEPDAGDKSFRKLIRPILAWLAERYSEELSRNVQRGMRSQAEKGQWQYGHAPFGYAMQGGRLVVTDSTRADFETVKRVFSEYLDGRDGGKRLAEKLTREGVNPPGRADLPRERHGGTWRRKHIQQLLTSKVYAGHVVYDGEIVARDAHPAAVTDDDFVRVAAIRKLRERAKTEGSNGHNPIRLGEHGLFTPWLRCGTCGGRICVTVGGRSGKADYYYYVCATRQENKENCLGLTVRVDVMDPGLLDYIASEVLTKENVRALIDRSVIDLADAPDSIAQDRDALEATIAELDRKIRVVGQSVIDGVFAPSDAKALNAPLIAQRDTAQLKLASMPQRRELPGVEKIDPEKFRASVLQAWTDKPIDLRREALDRLLERITLDEGGVHVQYAVKDEPPFRHQAPAGPPNAPMSPRDPSTSKYVSAGSPASINADPD
jgi:DNA invertase Pin-like site-specific DNA recombinase